MAERKIELAGCVEHRMEWPIECLHDFFPGVHGHNNPDYPSVASDLTIGPHTQGNLVLIRIESPSPRPLFTFHRLERRGCQHVSS